MENRWGWTHMSCYRPVTSSDRRTKSSARWPRRWSQSRLKRSIVQKNCKHNRLNMNGWDPTCNHENKRTLNLLIVNWNVNTKISEAVIRKAKILNLKKWNVGRGRIGWEEMNLCRERRTSPDWWWQPARWRGSSTAEAAPCSHQRCTGSGSGRSPMQASQMRLWVGGRNQVGSCSFTTDKSNALRLLSYLFECEGLVGSKAGLQNVTWHSTVSPAKNTGPFGMFALISIILHRVQATCYD